MLSDVKEHMRLSLGKGRAGGGGRKRPEHRLDTRVVSTTFRIADQTDQASKPALKVVAHLPSIDWEGVEE